MTSPPGTDSSENKAVTSAAERDELRASVRRLFEKHSPPAEVIRWLETPPGYDRRLLEIVRDEANLFALRVPERLGGMGYGWRELGIVLEETGRALTAVPFLSGQIAALVVEHLADESARADVLSGVATGAISYTVAGVSGGPPFAGVIATHVGDEPEEWLLEGASHFVLDGAHADVILVIAHAAGEPSLFAVDPSSRGLTRTPLVSMDMTRPLADLIYRSTPARLIGRGTPADVQKLGSLLSLLLASEQLGGSRGALDQTVDHLQRRVQFGRPIGSFQAVKHRCADLLVAIEGAGAVTRAALRAADSDSSDLSLLSHLAASVCSETYFETARAMVQLHGGLGFTWEHISHVHLKRAKVSQLLFGAPATHRRRIADIVGIPTPASG